MVITIVQPTPSGAFGPGFPVLLDSDVAGPHPAGSTLRIEIRDAAATERVWGFFSRTTTEPDFGWTAGERDDGSFVWPNLQSSFPHGLNVQVIARRFNNLGQLVEESAPQTNAWDLLAGQAIQAQLQTGTTGGLTPAQDHALMMILPWAIWDLIGEFAPELFDLIRDKVGSKFNKVLYTPIRVDIGQLEKPDIGPFFRWVGIEWQVVFAPEGIGIDVGNPETSEVNWGQLSYFRENGDGSFAASETSYEGRLFAQWFWGTTEPHHIAYYILPGIQVQFWALTLLEPAAELAGDRDNHQLVTR